MPAPIPTLSETRYFETSMSQDILDAASLEDLHAGRVLISIENHVTPEGGVDEWIAQHPGDFFQRLRVLPREWQDVLLQSFVINATQFRIGPFHSLTQTAVSTLSRSALMVLAGRHRDLNFNRSGEPAKRRKNGQPRKIRQAKRFHVYRHDPAILGQFRINIEDPDFGHVFMPTARTSEHVRLSDNFQHKIDAETLSLKGNNNDFDSD